MTQPNPLIPSQEAREAAADVWRDYVAKIGECIVERALREGRNDDTLIIYHFARFEQAIRRDEAEQCARVADRMQQAAAERLAEKHDDDAAAQHDTALEIAAAIRARHDGGEEDA